MERSLGMPAARAFSTSGATDDEPVFVINRLHLTDWRDAVRRAGVELGKYELFEGKEVIGFSADEARTLLINANLVISKRHPSDTPHVEWLWLQDGLDLPPPVRALIPADPLSPVSPVEIGTWEGSGKRTFAYIASQILGRATKRKIILSGSYGRHRQYDNNGDFQIYVWSTPLPETELVAMPPERVWNIPVHHMDGAFQPRIEDKKRAGRGKKSVVGVPITDGKYIVAELFPNALYIHHDLIHNGCEHEFMLFAEIMTRTAKYMADPAAWERYLEESRRQMELAREKAITALIDRSVAKRAGRTTGALKAARAQAERLRAEYFAAEREVFVLQEGNSDPERARRSFLAEFKKLETGQVGYIETIKFNPDQPGELQMFTKEITAQDPQTDKHHLLGRFELVFNLDQGRVRMINKDRTVNDGRKWHAPHVFGDGSVCMGNIESELQAYIAHFEIEAAATLAIGFLQSVKNEHSYTDRLKMFPAAKEAAQP